MRPKHKHDWEELRYNSTDPKPYAIRCKICPKISYPNKTLGTYIRKGRLHHNTQGAFGRK